MFVELCDWKFRYISQFLQVGVIQLLLKCCHILKSGVEMLSALRFAVSGDAFIIIV